MASESLVLAMQGSCLLNHTHHPVTTGLGSTCGDQGGRVGQRTMPSMPACSSAGLAAMGYIVRYIKRQPGAMV